MNIVYISLGIVFLLLIVSKMNKKKKRKNQQIHVIGANCSGCRRCVKRCRRNVLEILNEDNVTSLVVKNPENCSVCGDCIGVCKFKALIFVPREKD